MGVTEAGVASGFGVNTGTFRGSAGGWRTGAYNASPVGGLGQLASFKATGASLAHMKGALQRGRKLLEHLRQEQ